MKHWTPGDPPEDQHPIGAKALLASVGAAALMLAAVWSCDARGAEVPLPVAPVTVGSRIATTVVCKREAHERLLSAQRKVGIRGLEPVFSNEVANGGCLTGRPAVFLVRAVEYAGLLDDGHNWLIQVTEDWWVVAATEAPNT